MEAALPGGCAAWGDVTRLRLGVVLLLPPGVAAEVDGLRRGGGDPALGAIPAHLTLVPPVNVRPDDLAAALAVLRAAAAGSPPALALTVGPAATFHPVTPTAFLAVGGSLHGLHGLRDRVFSGPFERRLDHPFHPHVTLTTDQPPERLTAMVMALADYRAAVTVERVTVMAERRHSNGRRVWTPLADAALGPAIVVGRGGLPLELADTGVPDSEVQARLAEGGVTFPAGCRVLCARRNGAGVGAAVVRLTPPCGPYGARGVLEAVVVDPAEGRTGVGGRLLDHAAALAAGAGAARLEASPGAVDDDWLAALGWREPDDLPRPAGRWRPV